MFTRRTGQDRGTSGAENVDQKSVPVTPSLQNHRRSILVIPVSETLSPVEDRRSVHISVRLSGKDQLSVRVHCFRNVFSKEPIIGTSTCFRNAFGIKRTINRYQYTFLKRSQQRTNRSVRILSYCRRPFVYRTSSGHDGMAARLDSP